MDNDSKPLNQLRPAPYNPRRMDQHDREALHMSMSEFGDLDCIVSNVTTGNLVTGHQRIKELMSNPRSRVQYTEKFEQPDSLGTVARGYVVIDGTDYRFAYREVAWDHVKEKQANVIANYAQGEFVVPLLASITSELAALGDEVVAKTGQRQDEIKTLLRSLDKPKKPEAQPPKIVDSRPGCTYKLGSGSITAGPGELEFIDQVRRDYAERNGQLADWQEFTPCCQMPNADTQPAV